MTDMFSKKKRSWIMSRIRSKNTSIDKKMHGLLSRMGVKFVMYPDMLGKPDFKVGNDILVFCDGDFWHGYKYETKKRLAKKYWRKKIERNMQRDRYVSRRLRMDRWSVLRMWEHDIMNKPEKCERRLLRKIDERK